MDSGDCLFCVVVCENSVGYFYILRKVARCLMNSGDCAFFGVLVLEKCQNFLQVWSKRPDFVSGRLLINQH